MFDSENPPIYKKVFTDLLKALSETNLAQKNRTLGLKYLGNPYFVPLLNKIYEVSSLGIITYDQKSVSINHRICSAYCILKPGKEKQTERFVPCCEFFAGGDFFRNLSRTVKWPQAEYFEEKIKLLNKKAFAFRGQISKPQVHRYSASIFEFFPKIPFLNTFFHEDRNFRAQVKISMIFASQTSFRWNDRLFWD